MPESIIPDNLGKDKPDKIENVITSFFRRSFDWKIGLLLFIVYICINTNVFIERILNNIPGAVDNNMYPSSTGVIIQALLLSLIYIIANGLLSLTE